MSGLFMSGGEIGEVRGRWQACDGAQRLATTRAARSAASMRWLDTSSALRYCRYHNASSISQPIYRQRRYYRYYRTWQILYDITDIIRCTRKNQRAGRRRAPSSHVPPRKQTSPPLPCAPPSPPSPPCPQTYLCQGVDKNDERGEVKGRAATETLEEEASEKRTTHNTNS